MSINPSKISQKTLHLMALFSFQAPNYGSFLAPKPSQRPNLWGPSAKALASSTPLGHKLLPMRYLGLERHIMAIRLRAENHKNWRKLALQGLEVRPKTKKHSKLPKPNSQPVFHHPIPSQIAREGPSIENHQRTYHPRGKLPAAQEPCLNLQSEGTQIDLLLDK